MYKLTKHKSFLLGSRFLSSSILAMGMVVGYPTTSQASSAATPLTQQQNQTKGHIVDENGEPMIGVTIKATNGKAMAVTDLDGNYTINAPVGTRLEISYTGYKTMTINAGGTVQMKPDVLGLDDVVVVGYGTMKKSDLTGTTAQLKSEEITSGVTGNALENLQGKAAGVAVFNNNQPGAAPSIRVRGSGSISASSEPLYVVDGFPLMDGDISDINPADIESMEVLKDASSTAIYGSRGANGVVMITTKKGNREGKHLSVTSNFGVQMPGRKMNLISGKDFLDFENAAYKNQGSNAIFNGDEDTPTNWEDEILKKSAIIQDYNINFNGMAGSTQYMLSGGYYNQEGLIPTQEYEKISFHTNLQHQFNSWLTVGANMQYTYATRNDQNNALINLPRYGWPTDSPYDEDGRLTVPSNSYITDAWNPLIDFEEETHERKTNRVILNTFAEAKILPHLTYRLSLGQDVRNIRYYDYHSSQTVDGLSKGNGNGGQDWSKNRSKIMENILSYSNQWNKHRLTATGVYSWQDFVYEKAGLKGSGFQLDPSGAWDMGLADRASVNWNTTKYSNTLISFTGRVTYAYDDRYLLTATSRWDGSSRFGENNKWGYFPSVGIAWRVSQEKFLVNNQVITNLKLRASFGVTGNQEIGNYKSLPQLLAKNYTDGTKQLTGYYETIGNSDLKWERTRQWNFGFDLGLFNRLNLTVDCYNRDTRDLLYNVPIPSTSGYESILSNIGRVKNYGMEMSIDANVFKNKDWMINVGVNGTYNKNEIKSLYGDVKSVTLSNQSMGLSRRLVVGQPVDGVYALHSLGIIKTQEQLDAYKAAVPSTASTAQLGDEMYEDTNEDGKISVDDYKCIGSIQPKFFYGMNINVSWRELSLSIYGQGGSKYASIAGGDNSAFSSDKLSSSVMGYADTGSYLLYGENQVTNLTYIPTQYAYDRMWSTNNPDGNYPAPGAHNTFLSDRTNGNWNYFILKNIRIAYDFTKLINVKTVKGVSASLNFQNFVTFANHRGYNPINGDISNPWAKSITLGVNVKL